MSPTFRFIPAMYRKAVVERVKTQTRRVMSPQPVDDWRPTPGPCYHYAPAIVCRDDGMLDAGPEVYGIATENEGWIATYGPPGTILPVVTTWAVAKEWDDLKPSIMDPEVVLAEHGIWWHDGSPKPAWAGKSRPSMFVPKAFYPHAVQARVEAVKAEAVQDISAEDAIAEGVDPLRGGWKDYAFPRGTFPSPIASFRSLWDSINAARGEGQYAWNRNPMVFATSFSILPAS